MEMLDRQRVWTYRDYLDLPDDGQRYEILEGVLYVSPAPRSIHQFLSKRLQRVLERLEEDGLGWVFAAPFEVVMPGSTPVQPDLVFVSVAQRHILTPKGVNGVPTLLVEILSGSNQRHDRVTKLNSYAQAGVLHYWLLASASRSLEVLRLQGTHYVVLASLGPGDRFTHPDFPSLELSVDELFRDIPPEIEESQD